MIGLLDFHEQRLYAEQFDWMNQLNAANAVTHCYQIKPVQHNK